MVKLHDYFKFLLNFDWCVIRGQDSYLLVWGQGKGSRYMHEEYHLNKHVYHLGK